MLEQKKHCSHSWEPLREFTGGVLFLFPQVQLWRSTLLHMLAHTCTYLNILKHSCTYLHILTHACTNWHILEHTKHNSYHDIIMYHLIPCYILHCTNYMLNKPVHLLVLLHLVFVFHGHNKCIFVLWAEQMYLMGLTNVFFSMGPTNVFLFHGHSKCIPWVQQMYFCSIGTTKVFLSLLTCCIPMQYSLCQTDSVSLGPFTNEKRQTGI